MNQSNDKKIKVLFDSTIFDLQIFGGISRYFSELISVGAKRKLFKPLFRLLISDNEYAKISGHTRLKSNLHRLRVKGSKRLSWKLNGLANSFYTNRHLRKGDFDIYHPTYYSHKSIHYSDQYKIVLTVYDMIHEKFPDLFSDAEKVIEIKKQLIFRSAAIIAISENTRRDILEFYPEIDPAKISVTHLASSIGSYTEIKVELPLKKFLVFVGNREGYKNFMPMLQVLISTFKSQKDLGLICVGGGSFNQNERVFLKDENLSDRIVQKNLSDSELKWIYSNSVALLFPSEYEGFGIPVIEAFECGCPVILPKLSSFPEIGGDAGLFYEKSDMVKINFYIEQLISDEKFRCETKDKCKNQATQFSWEKMTMETLEVYKRTVATSDRI